ncbi:MAG TPA: PIG-L family deacetylase [Bacteroidota bacterium]
MIPLLLTVLVPLALRAGEQSPDSRQALLDLSQDGVLMDISAHPDDEDGATLAYYRLKFGVRTYSVLFTRGEGGQNEKGPELYEELGVLRSRETEEAGRVLGAEVHFLNFLDFGYSKTASETFQKWGGEREALRRLVYVIRKYKPDVLFTNHNTIDGHGNHQAVAITAIAAFEAAADSTWFPEQLREEGITIWQPRKLFFRAFGRFEGAVDVSNDINALDAVRGKTYLDIAVDALRKHRTQGMERANLRAFTRGKSLYRLVRANSLYEQDSTSFFSGIDFFRDPSVAMLGVIRRDLDRLHAGMPQDSMLALVAAVYARSDSLRMRPGLSDLARRMLGHWDDEAGDLAAALCGITVALRPQDSVVVPRQRVDCDLTVSSSGCNVGDVRWSFRAPAGWVIDPKPDAPHVISGGTDHRVYTLTVGEDAQPTLPRTVSQYRSIELRQELSARVDLTVDGHPVRFTVVPSFDVAPPLTIEVNPRSVALLRSRVREGVVISYTVRNFLPHKTAGRVGIRASQGWSADNAPFVIASEDSVATGSLRVRPPAEISPGAYTIHVRTELASVPVVVHVIAAAVDPGVHVGIIRSQDNTIESAAGTLGVDYALVSDAELRSGSLSHYTTIVVDIRAYLLRDTLREHNSRLLDYVRSGGNLVVMYQREREWKPEYAPFPFQVTGKRVCVEEAPIRVLVPSHPLLNAPNRIGESDWQGWIQERGVYYPSNVPGEYARLLSSADPDEPQLDTGYLEAPYGKGSYIYTCYVWYRQLKEGNSGAFRCFANMLSYPYHRRPGP